MKTRIFKGYEIVDLREGDPGVAMCCEVGPTRRLCNRPRGHVGRHIACSIDLGGEPIDLEDSWGPSESESMKRLHLRRLREQAADAIEALVTEQLRLINEFPPNDLEELKEQGAVYPFTREDLVWCEDWECEVCPTGRCVYDLNSDPGDCDECIYCKEPLERK